MDKRRAAVIAAIATAIAVPADGLRQVLSAPFTFFSFNKSPCHIVSLRGFVPGANRRSRGFSKRPLSGRNSIVHHPNRASAVFGYFSPRNVVIGHVNNSSISSLSFSSGPRAVFWSISKGIIFALYRQVISIARSFRPLKKCFKNMPFLANCYSFSTIYLVGYISAPPKHIAPTVMDSGTFHSMCCAALAYCRPRAFASTGGTLTTAQVSPNDNTFSSTRALA
jgi:hypothetical protein